MSQLAEAAASNSRAQGGTPLADPLKAWRTAQARAALAGYQAEVIQLDNGQTGLVLSRWNLTRTFDDVAAVEAWLVRAGASSDAPIAQ